jgi:hypothetical protein
MAKILWEYGAQDIRQPVIIEPLGLDEVSLEYEVFISHDSDKPITQCALYLQPFSGDYQGTESPKKDYERLLWMANNYEGYGLSVIQEYLATGNIDDYGQTRLVDLNRAEPADIFKGESLEITSGAESGQSIEVVSYDPIKKIFNLASSFFEDVTGDNYKIDIQSENYFKAKQGSNFAYPVSILHRGGTINRFEKISFKVKLKIPPYSNMSGVFYFDLNLRFTSVEEGNL